jgi:tRNA 2-thiocytidine biosynthesis protein TtcA
MKNLPEFLRKNMELAINDYGMIQPGDRILVGISGGADSFSLLDLLTRKKVFVSNEIFIQAAHVEMGFSREPEINISRLETYFKSINIPFHVEKTTIGPYAHSEENRLNPCFLCSRLRRTRLFEIAKQTNCTKIALGHHKDDIIETFLINILFGRETSTMLPKQEFFKGEYYIIRPLAYLEKQQIDEFARQNNFPLFENECPTNGHSKRAYVKELIQKLEKDYRGVKGNIYKAMKNVKSDYMLQSKYKNPR